MSLRFYIWGLVISMLLALAIWIFVIFNIDPYESGFPGQVFFFASFFLFLMGVFVNILVWLRIKFLGGEVAVENMGLSFRQGTLLAILVVVLIGLNMMGYLIWWVGLLVVAGIFLVELFFLSR
ncbi:MAG TPA: hypothetical protein ENJ27_00955 [Candidatus Moranbacteria bacterium]|nr:hypothetical protein [Candidatus Moranbacteria bacterium]